MSPIILTDELVCLLAMGPLPVFDRERNIIGQIEPIGGAGRIAGSPVWRVVEEKDMNLEVRLDLLLARGPLPVCDGDGNIVGQIEPIGFTPQEIAEAKRRAASPGPWYTGEQVRSHLAALEEAANSEGGLDKFRMDRLLEQLRSRVAWPWLPGDLREQA